MSMIGTPCLAMLLVLANIALCLTAEYQKTGSFTPPTAAPTFAALPLGRLERRDRAPISAGLAARRH